MKARILGLLLSILLLAGGIAGPAVAAGKNAIVLAHFGTTVPEAVKAITGITDRVRTAYPNTEVRLTFTSNIIRSVWKKRQAEEQKWIDMGVPREVLYVKNVISTIGDLQEDGYTCIIVQPSHMFFMEQSHDLLQYINGLAGIRTLKDKWRPFDQLVMGRPALGMPGDRYDYHKDIDAAARTLAADVSMARQAGAALVYLGHGNEYWSTGVYGEMQKKMGELYPDVPAYFGTVEGYPTIEDVVAQLKHGAHRKVLLKPFMIVAGTHAVEDMAGEQPGSWKSILTAAGYQVTPVLAGLGENDAFIQLFVDHIADAAAERGIKLE